MDELREPSKLEKLLEEGAYVTVSFKEDGSIHKVFGPNGKEVAGEKLNSHNMIKIPIDQVDTVTILSSPGKSPCCIVVGTYRYCWC